MVRLARKISYLRPHEWNASRLIGIDELGYVPLAEIGAELLFQVDRRTKPMGGRPPSASSCPGDGVAQSQGGHPMHLSTVGLDLAKRVFQIHGVDAHGNVVMSKRLRRAQVLTFFAKLPPCLVGMEACGHRTIGRASSQPRP